MAEIPDSRATEGAYSMADVVVIHSPAEHIRRRPAMYIGSTGADGLLLLASTLLEVAVEGAQEAPRTVEVDLLADGGLRVRDDGPPPPLGAAPSLGRPWLEAMLTDVLTSGAWRVGAAAPGLHGIGLVTASALAERLVVEVEVNGQRWQTEARRGEVVVPLTAVGAATLTGTTFTFQPDPTIFGAASFDLGRLAVRLRELAALIGGLQVRLTDQRQSPAVTEHFHCPEGVADLFRYSFRDGLPTHGSLCHFRASEGEMAVEAVLGWAEGERVHSYAGTEFTPWGGTHQTGLLTGCVQAVRAYLEENGYSDPSCPVAPEDIRDGLCAVVAIWLPEPQFEGPTRGRLNNPEVTPFVREHTTRAVRAFLAAHPDDARAIAAHIVAARSNRLAARVNSKNRRRH